MTTSDSTPRRSSRRHALKNANPQQVLPHVVDDPREPACIENDSRETISKNPRKQDGNEGDGAGMGHVAKGDSEDVNDDDKDAEATADGEGRGGENNSTAEEAAEDEGEEGEVKEEGGRDLGAGADGEKEDDSVEISPAKKGGLQCPLCPSSCNYRSLLLNHIRKFHPGNALGFK